jgi:cytochrome c-type biogenesis protein CcmH
MAAWAGRTTRERVIVGLVAVLGLGAYWAMGRPGMPDQPLESRMEALEERARTDAESFNGAEVMALLQHRARKSPADPTPYKFMGDILAGAGRPDEAMLQYQSALRRDPLFAPAMISLADLRFKSTGELDELTARLYREAYGIDSSNPRVGYMAGIADWRDGRKDEATALWAKIEAETPAQDPRQQMFRALRETFVPDSLSPGPTPETAPPTR